MLNSLKIENFKNIKAIDIPKLARINLVTGSNNTSKTTLLEAVGLLASNIDFKWMYSILRDRGELFFNENENVKAINNFKSIRSFFHNREINYNNKKSIFIGNEEDFIGLSFVYYIDRITHDIEDNDKIIIKKVVRHTLLENDDLEDSTLGLAVSYKDGSKTIPLTGNGYAPEPVMQWIASLEPKTKFQFIKPSFKENRLNGNLWDKIALSEKEDYVIEILRIIEKDLDKIAFIKQETADDERRVTAKVRGNTERVPLQSMGDGINRVLSIALGLVNAEGGYLLIDEFENGLHYLIQEKLWEVIFKLSEKLNIQVFATTHSNDCVSAFSKVTNAQKYIGMGQLIRLERKNNDIKIVDYSSNELKIADENNIELR